MSHHAELEGYGWEKEKKHFGFHPAAFLDDTANAILDCAPPRPGTRALGSCPRPARDADPKRVPGLCRHVRRAGHA